MKIYKNSAIIKDCIYAFSFRNKYDIISNDVARYIFDLVKNKKFGEYSKDDIWIEIAKIDKLNKLTFDNFSIKAVTKNGSIYLSIFINDDFNETDYQNFNYVLYEVIRHELEHKDSFILNKRPDSKYVEMYNKLLSNMDLEEHAETISEYILSDTEIDAYVKSIMYVAKKQKVSTYDIIEQVIKRAFFNNNSNSMLEGIKNSKIKSLVEKTRDGLRAKIIEYYPKFKEQWL